MDAHAWPGAGQYDLGRVGRCHRVDGRHGSGRGNRSTPCPKDSPPHPGLRTCRGWHRRLLRGFAGCSWCSSHPRYPFGRRHGRLSDSRHRPAFRAGNDRSLAANAPDGSDPAAPCRASSGRPTCGENRAALWAQHPRRRCRGFLHRLLGIAGPGGEWRHGNGRRPVLTGDGPGIRCRTIDSGGDPDPAD